MNEVFKDHFENGIYKCKKCNSELFKSESKFKTSTFWPSFRESIEENILIINDKYSKEVYCYKCKTLIGHLYDDGIIFGDKHEKAGNRF
jgi:peptide methionine sulfoxide reductase MsrB